MNIKKILVAVYALSTTIAFAQEKKVKRYLNLIGLFKHK
jgi:hypothetical protein